MPNPCAPLMATFAIALFTLTGCGGGTAPVTGVITLNAQPVGPGTVTFMPLNEQAEKDGATRAMGEFGADGNYTLISPGGKQGVTPGKYKVTVQAASAEGYGVEGGTRTPSKIPIHYADPAQSDLTAEVTSGENTINFDLKPAK